MTTQPQRKASPRAGWCILALAALSAGPGAAQITLPAPEDGGTPRDTNRIRQIGPQEFYIRAAFEEGGPSPLRHAVSRVDLLCRNAGTGTLGLDMVSLFPRETFRHRPNGLRPDLAEAIANLKPRFIRFPGGGLVHGDGLDNMYRWKDTIGPVEQRKAQPNIWRYHQTVGLGYFEYFQFCEDIGAKPLPVVTAGVCCQNSGASITGKWGQGQEGLPLSEMSAYVREVLDLIEWANSPAASPWGAKRAAADIPSRSSWNTSAWATKTTSPRSFASDSD